MSKEYATPPEKGKEPEKQEQPREQRRQGTLIRGPNGALYFVPGSLDVFEVTEEQEKERILSALADDDRKLLEDSPAPPDPQDLQAGKATVYTMKTIAVPATDALDLRSEEHTSELQSLMRISYAVFCLHKKRKNNTTTSTRTL